MDRDETANKLRQGAFRDNNGSVLRTINILRHKFVKLRDVKYALDISESEIVDCVNFLAEEEYIELREISTKVPADLADVMFEDIEAKLTGKGIRLLAGDLKDNLIRI